MPRYFKRIDHREDTVAPGDAPGDLMGCYGILWDLAIEIVDFPIEMMLVYVSQVNQPERHSNYACFA